jgi:hypothetical protein
MIINKTPYNQLLGLNIIDFLEYRDENDFYDILDNCTHDVNYKYFYDLDDAKKFYQKLSDLLLNDEYITDRVILLLTKSNDRYIVGSIEQTMFTVDMDEDEMCWDTTYENSSREIRDIIEMFK